jgi:exodeoxyribonuclease V alpha subunit
MESSILIPRFPILESAALSGSLAYVDLEFAKMLFKDMPEIDQTAVGLVCHLTKSSRVGHLCVIRENGQLTPSPVALWAQDADKEISAELAAFLENLPEGFERLPESICSRVSDHFFQYPNTPLCMEGDRLYLQKNWVFETHFILSLQQLACQRPSLEVTPDLLEPFLLEKCAPLSLNKEQTAAVRNAFEKSLSVISGGPGTGKTYTAGCFVKLFLELFADRPLKIALTAPTGKAASRLRASLGNISGHAIEALTLHSLLKMTPDTPYAYPPKERLAYDLLLIDECSMIDVKLMTLLLPAIKEGARVIFLGDPNQLPSVESGSLFADMMQVLNAQSKVHLQECLRVELKELVEFGESIKKGLAEHFPPCVKRLIPKQESAKRQETEIIQEIIKLWPSPDSVASAESTFNRFRVLSPLRKGIFGVDAVNDRLLQLTFEKAVSGEPFAVPIMITQNHSKRELFNGETGVLVRNKGASPYLIQEGDYALFGGRKIPALLLPAFEYAFCLSVHKSQGSEFDHVMLLLPQGSEVFGREMLYTAVTRARKELTIWGTSMALNETLLQQSLRCSGVSARISFDGILESFKR